MKPRIEKKLSKRLCEVAPRLFKDAWRCKDTGVMCVGGGVDYWGEGQDEFTVYEDWRAIFMWHSSLFPVYPEGHKFEDFPNTEGFKVSAKSLIALAVECEAGL